MFLKKCPLIKFTTAVTAVMLMLSIQDLLAGQVRVAVAANFTKAAQEISKQFEAQSASQVVLSFGSTGLLYTQITQGAPFDVFLAADQTHPLRLIQSGLAEENNRFTYAIGRLVLYSSEPDRVDGSHTLLTDKFNRIAIANPATAPYGAAAIQTLQQLGIHSVIAPRIVRGQNVTQAYQFVASGNAELGFIALSLIDKKTRGSFWIVPQELHTPIAQDAILLKRGQANTLAQAFVDFLKSSQAKTIIKNYGYDIHY